MVRVREIIDPVLRDRVIDALALRQGVRPGDIPHWYEMEDADYSDLLQELNEASDVVEADGPDDSED